MGNQKLQHLYRSLDLLSESKEIFEEEIFYKKRNLFNIQVMVATANPIADFHCQAIIHARRTGYPFPNDIYLGFFYRTKYFISLSNYFLYSCFNSSDEIYNHFIFPGIY